MLTKKDVELLLEHFVTRTEFEQAIQSIKEQMVTKQDHNLVMTTLDKVLKEVITTRQEQTINSHRHDETEKEIGDLKKRVTRLEDKQPIQHI